VVRRINDIAVAWRECVSFELCAYALHLATQYELTCFIRHREGLGVNAHHHPGGSLDEYEGIGDGSVGDKGFFAPEFEDVAPDVF